MDQKPAAVKREEPESRTRGVLPLPQENFPAEGIAIYAIDSRTGALQLQYANDACLSILNLKQSPALPCRLGALGLDADTGWKYEQKLRRCLMRRSEVREVQSVAGDTAGERPYAREVCVTAAESPVTGERFLIEVSRRTADEEDAIGALARKSPSFAALLAQSMQRVWELDFKTSKFTLFTPAAPGSDAASVEEFRFPDDFISQGIVHSRSLADFRVFARKLCGGEHQGGTTLIMRTADGAGYAWHAMRFRMIAAGDGLPRKAVGVLRTIAAGTVQPRFLEIDRLWERLLPALCCFANVNLTTGFVERLWVSSGEVDNSPSPLAYGEVIESIVHKFFAKTSREQALKLLAPGRLMELARERTPSWACIMVDLVEENAYVRPATIHILLETADSGEVRAYFFVQYTQLVGRPALARRLPASCAFSHDDARGWIIKHLQQSKADNAHALIRICDIPDGACPMATAAVTAAFSLFFESFAILSTLSERTVSVFMPEIESSFKAREKLEASFEFVRKTLSGTRLANVRFVSALSFGVLKDYYHEDFLREASLVCNRLENEPLDTIERIAPISEIRSQQSQNAVFAAVDEELVKAPPPAADLDKEETACLLSCLDAVVRNDSADAALSHILASLGKHYQADRVYLVRLIEGMMTLEVTGEWDNARMGSFKLLINGSRLKKFPLLERVFTSGKSVSIARRPRTVELQHADGRLEGTWSYAAVACRPQAGTVKLVLCLDNPHENGGRLALPQALAPYLLLVHERLEKQKSSFLTAGDFGARVIEDLAEYRQVLSRLTCERYSSMGALVAAVPRLLVLDDAFGTEHCRNLLASLRELLARSFGNSVIFKKYTGEFVVLVPNTTHEVFFERVDWVQRACEKQFPGQVSTGATWSMEVFNVNALVEEARTFMLIQSGPVPPSIGRGSGQSVEAPAMLRNFIIHLQPKVDMRTREVVGAEALVRGVDAQGRIIAPAGFISQMEQGGMLRNLDLFVFSRVLWQLAQWKKEGLPLVPVSVNFSRYTLFDRATSGAVLAILSNYEDIDPGLIEIEITETACTVEHVTLERALAPYRRMGLRFALDDFGTGYANLSIFSQVRFETIKLDRTLVRDIPFNPMSRSLIESIVRISHEHRMVVVAEGVETESQAKTLVEKECFIAQGNYFEKPMDIRAFTSKCLAKEPAAASL